MIEWKEKTDANGNTIYSSGPKTEYLIFKETDGCLFWILTYPDFWTVGPDAFLVNVKKTGPENFAVSALKKYAEEVHQKYIDYRKFQNWE